MLKVGDQVRLNPNKRGREFTYGQGLVDYEEVGRVAFSDGYLYKVVFPSQQLWRGRGDDCIPILNISDEDLWE